ncbi:MAG: CPBP family intramembrane metalloprotease, partial [Coriobacteriales bacterium]|nr:CPBP family intramembrane metalloprotease [Coriobacteriales bacterium]
MEVTRSKIFVGIGSFAVVMLVLLALGFVLPAQIGMWGTVISEAVCISAALVGWQLSKLPFKQMFPLVKATFRQWRGGLCIYLGCFFGTYAVTLLMAALFPGMSEVGAELGGYISSVNILFAIFAVVILPGICEEFLHRGLILTSLGSITSVAVRVLIMGVIFGLFHTDIYRFMPTMILGMGLSYMRIKTGTMLLPMVFHALNNLFSTVVTFLLVETVGSQLSDLSSTSQMSIDPVVLLCMLVFLIPLSALFLYLGVMGLNKKPAEKTTPPLLVPAPPTGATPPPMPYPAPYPPQQGQAPYPPGQAAQYPQQQEGSYQPGQSAAPYPVAPPASYPPPQGGHYPPPQGWQYPPPYPPQAPKSPTGRRTALVVTLCLVVSLIGCCACIGASMLTSLDSTYNATFEFNDDKPKEYSDSFTIVTEGTYVGSVSVAGSNSNTRIELTDSTGSVIYTKEDLGLMNRFTLDLEKGSYTFTITVEPIVKRDTQVIIAFM